MEAQYRCGWIEIGFVVVKDARGDPDCGGTRDRNFAVVRKVEYLDGSPTLVFHVHGHECLEYFEVTEIVPWPLGNDFPPMRCRGHCLRRAYQPEVRRVEISADEEPVAHMIDFIEDALPPRLNYAQLSHRPISGQITKLAGALPIDVEEDELTRPRQPDRNVERRIALLIDQRVGLGIRAKPMPPDLVGTQGGRLIAHIKDRIAVGGEREIRAGIVNALIDGFASRDCSHEDPEITTTCEIDSEYDAR